ncbi:MAG: type II toxin-antitoxin system RelE/ParE family toxin [Candidatus Omnitrophota bacterium]
MYEVEFYKDRKGRCLTIEFLDGLETKKRAKVARWIDKLEKEGPDLPRPYADILRGKIRELRVGFGSNEYRFLYFFFGKRIIITHGFLKKTDRVTEGEIERAERMMQDFSQISKRG